MMIQMKCAALLIVLMVLSGCGGANTHYAWNNYDAELYEHYKDPAQKEVFVQSLKEIIQLAESEGKVPPGIYAEYGFLLYEKGDTAQAVQYYQKEADKWPESKFLMTKMIANTQKQTTKQDGDAKPAATTTPPPPPTSQSETGALEVPR